MNQEPKRVIDVIFKPGLLWKLLHEYLGLDRWRRLQPVNDFDSLQQFINTRASFIAQSSLYGYLRTRAGMRYPELFEDDRFVSSINIAKWQIWLACVSDLSVYVGGLLMQHPHATQHNVSLLLQKVVFAIMEEVGTPTDAGDAFPDYVERVRQRVTNCDWKTVTDDESAFSESPLALVQWAPIVENLKQLDEQIVKNSIRFRWQSVRRDLRRALNTDALLGLEV